MYVYYNAEGELLRIPSGKWTSFNELRAQGLNTATNYFFAETILWPDVKIAALKDAQEEVVGHRYEARMFGVGAWQHQGAYLITTALAFNDGFARGVNDLLGVFGFDMVKAETARAPVKAAYEAAREHGGQFFEVPYGSGTMQEFAVHFADLLEGAFAGGEFEDDIRPILDICRSGCTDGKVNRALFKTLEDMACQQLSYDHDMLLNPLNTARDLYDEEISKIKASGSQSAMCA
jgi:hypothetical protein